MSVFKARPGSMKVSIRKEDGTEAVVGIFNDVTYVTDVDAVCECGAKKIGVKKFEKGHSEWCPVFMPVKTKK